jgi:hypothetical protein
VTKVPNVRSYSARVEVRTQGRPVTNAPLRIPVRLEVIGPSEPVPVPLKLDREKLTFDYILNGPIPDPREVRVVQGDVGATASSTWILPTHTIKNITVALSPEGVPQ